MADDSRAARGYWGRRSLQGFAHLWCAACQTRRQANGSRREQFSITPHAMWGGGVSSCVTACRRHALCSHTSRRAWGSCEIVSNSRPEVCRDDFFQRLPFATGRLHASWQTTPAPREGAGGTVSPHTTLLRRLYGVIERVSLRDKIELIVESS